MHRCRHRRPNAPARDGSWAQRRIFREILVHTVFPQGSAQLASLRLSISPAPAEVVPDIRLFFARCGRRGHYSPISALKDGSSRIESKSESFLASARNFSDASTARLR